MSPFPTTNQKVEGVGFYFVSVMGGLVFTYRGPSFAALGVCTRKEYRTLKTVGSKVST